MGDLRSSLDEFLDGYLVTSQQVTLYLGGEQGTIWSVSGPTTAELSADMVDPTSAKEEADGVLLSAGFKRVTAWKDGDPITALVV